MDKDKVTSGEDKGRKGKLREKWPELLVLCVCVLVMAVGISRKQGYHMDELLSFELSNAEFNPWIVPTQPQGRLAKFVEQEIRGDSAGETIANLWETVKDVLIHKRDSKLLSYRADVYEEPVWIAAETFQDYLTVGQEDAFQYLSVYFNVKDDNHPPFHFMLLHTMSSLFRNCAEPFVGCVINVAAVTGILLLLLWLGKELTASDSGEDSKFAGRLQTGRAAGIFAALCYGLSAGALATVLLVRMYALLTFFCVAFFALHIKKWKGGGFGEQNKLLITVTVLGFLTQYFFLFYCLILAAVTAVLLLLWKRKKELFCYVRSMTIAAVIGVSLFPFAIGDVFSSGRGVEALENLSEGLDGFGSRLLAFLKILAGRTFGFWPSAVLAGMILLFCGAVILRRILGKKGFRGCREQQGVFYWMLLLPAAGYFLLAVRMSPYQVDRYIMPVFPFVILTAAVLLFSGGKKAAQRAGCCIGGLLLLCQVIGLAGYDGSYLYSGYETQRQKAEQYAHLPCICVYEGVGYYENLLEFTSYEKTLLVKPDELEDRRERASLEELSEAVVLIKEEVDAEKVFDTLEQEYGLTVSQWLFDGTGVYGDRAAVLGKAEDE